MSSAETALSPSGAARGTLRLQLGRIVTAGVAGATLGTLVINGVQTVVGSLTTVTLTNVLGPRGFGAYSFASTWALLLTIPSVLGMTPLVVRYVATYVERSEWSLLRGLVRRTNQVVILSSAAIAALAGVIGWLVLGVHNDLVAPFLTGMLFVPLVSLVTMRQATLSGLGKVVLGRVPDTVLFPVLLLSGLLVATLLTGGRYSASAAMLMQVAAAAVALVLGMWLLRRTLPAAAKRQAPAYETRAWVRGGLRFVAASVAIALEGQLGTIMLAAFKGSADTGVFAASVRVATFASFLYAATSYPMMPALARLHVKGAVADLERLSVRAARGVTVLSLPVLAIVVALAPTILGILGGGFTAGATTLRILLIGELIRQATGFGGTVLLMAGHESTFARIAIVVTAANVLACALLVPALGVEGAALATASAVVLQNVAMLLAAWRRTGVWTAAVPLPRRLGTVASGGGEC